MGLLPQLFAESVAGTRSNPDLGDKLKAIWLPNYLAPIILPATIFPPCRLVSVSEQIWASDVMVMADLGATHPRKVPIGHF